MNEQKTSLALMIENAKRDINVAVSNVIRQSNLPAYLIEGIIVGILSDIRNQKNAELIEEIKILSEREEIEHKEEGEK